MDEGSSYHDELTSVDAQKKEQRGKDPFICGSCLVASYTSDGGRCMHSESVKGGVRDHGNSVSTSSDTFKSKLCGIRGGKGRGKNAKGS